MVSSIADVWDFFFFLKETMQTTFIHIVPVNQTGSPHLHIDTA